MVEEKFKQYFIFDVGTQHKKICSIYKASLKFYGKYVQSMKSFYATDGKNDCYKDVHHFDLDYFMGMGSADLSERARLVIAKAKAIIDAVSIRMLSKAELRETHTKIREECTRQK